MSFFIFILLYIYTYIINLIIFILSNIYLFIFNNIIKNKYNLKQQSNILNLISLTKNFLYIFDKKVKVNNNTIFYNFYKDGKVINYKYFYIIHYNFNTNFTNAIYNYVVYISNIKNISVSKYNLNYFNDFQNSFIKNNIIKVSKTYISTFKKKNNFSYFFKKNYLYYIIEYKKKSFFLKNNLYSINFSVSNIIKYLSTYNININFLRKNKIFNKGRYSRNRQTYRTGVYWCLYINIIAVIAFYFWFYKFSINFGYCWWILIIFFASFILSRSLKYQYYNTIKVTNEFWSYYIWLVNLIYLIFFNYLFKSNKFFKNYIFKNNLYKYLNNNIILINTFFNVSIDMLKIFKLYI